MERSKRNKRSSSGNSSSSRSRSNGRKRFALPVAALLCALSLPPLLAGCDKAEQEQPGTEGGVPVAFGAVAVPVETRAGEITTANITSMGVYASYTGQGNFNDGSSPLNYMFNQKITRTGSASPWTYTPVKYWPKQAGDKITFFAYAPHSDNMKAGAFDGPGKTNTGELSFYYVTPTDAAEQVDLLIATSVNTTKPGSGGTVGFTFRHLMAKLTFQILSSEDITVQGIAIDKITTASYFYIGAGGFTWDSSEMDNSILPFAATMDMSITAGVKTDAATFFLFDNNTKKEDPQYGKNSSVTLYYRGTDNLNQQKTVLLPRGWGEGEAVNFILKLDQVKLDVSATTGGGMTWGGSGTGEEIFDSSAL